jgi:hypothetical protein
MFREVVVSMEEIFAIIRHFQQENQYLHDFIMYLQNNEASTSPGVFQQHKFQQRSLKSIFLTSLMGRIQSFEVSSITCV